MKWALSLHACEVCVCVSVCLCGCCNLLFLCHLWLILFVLSDRVWWGKGGRVILKLVNYANLLKINEKMLLVLYF